jgi:hypothetical protein
MPKPRVKKVKFNAEEMAYDIPKQLDFRKLRYVGIGLDALDRHVARKQAARMIRLAPDVAEAFRSDEEVNEALRLVRKMRELGRTLKRKKSA